MDVSLERPLERWSVQEHPGGHQTPSPDWPTTPGMSTNSGVEEGPSDTQEACVTLVARIHDGFVRYSTHKADAE
jgi:hypothetical protein